MNKKISERSELLDAQLRSDISWPRTYRIVAEGCLDTSWSEVLAGMQITPGFGDRPTESSVLIGSIRDGAELSGVLNTLHDMQCSLLSVEVVETDARSGAS